MYIGWNLIAAFVGGAAIGFAFGVVVITTALLLDKVEVPK